MENNERKPGESIKQWRARIKAQKKEQRIQEEIDKGELLDASIVVAPRFEATISQGTDDKKSRKNNHRVGQESVFGERKYRQNRSLARRAFNDLTDALRLTSPPTFEDGYGRTLNAEVPLQESAQGQELKRMGETAKDAGELVATGFAFGNPLTASGAMAPLITGSQAYWIGRGIQDGTQRIENIGEGVQNFVEDPSWQNAGAIVKEVPMLALDTAGALPVAQTVKNNLFSTNLQNFIKYWKDQNKLAKTLTLAEQDINKTNAFLNHKLNIDSRTADNKYWTKKLISQHAVQKGTPLGSYNGNVGYMKTFAANHDDIDDLFRSYILSDGTQIENVYVTEFRKFLQRCGIDSANFSSDELGKVLTANTSAIRTNMSGLLKDRIAWHTTSKDFDRFNWSAYTGNNTWNTGVYGSGNYFTLNTPADYGKIHIPVFINEVQRAIPVPSKSINSFKINRLPTNTIGIGESTGGTARWFRKYSGLSEGAQNEITPEIVISRDTGIKSIFPHPSRFIINSNGKVELVPTNWDDTRIYFKQGGKL